jgi:hypothetical protein
MGDRANLTKIEPSIGADGKWKSEWRETGIPTPR